MGAAMRCSITTHQNHTYHVASVVPDPDGLRYYTTDPDFKDQAMRAVHSGTFICQRDGTEMMVPGRDVRQVTVMGGVQEG